MTDSVFAPGQVARPPFAVAGVAENLPTHTAGSWAFDDICFDRRIAIHGGVTVFGRPYTVAWVNRPGSARAGQDKANARLIAAAPDLLEALKDLVQLEGGRFGTGVIKPGTYGAAVMNAARDAIAKAEGRDQ